MNWMDDARQLAAQCWCNDETSGIEMDARLAEAFARRLAAWMEAAAQNQRNTEFYRGLLDDCAEAIGPEAFTADDGTVMQDPVRLKIPEIVRRLAQK